MRTIVILLLLIMLRTTDAQEPRPPVPTTTATATGPAATPQPATTKTTAAVTASTRPQTSAPVERPAWVDAAPDLRNGTFHTKVFVGPDTTRSECEQKIPEAVVSAARDYLLKTLGPERAAHVRLDFETLRPRIVDGDYWQETISTSELQLVYLHVPLKFDDKLRGEWGAQAESGLRQIRLANVAVAYGLVLAGLAVLLVAAKLLAGAPLPTWHALRGLRGAVILIAVFVGFFVMFKLRAIP